MFGLSELATRIIGGILLVAAIFGYGYYRGHSAVMLQFSQYKAEVQAAADQQAKETAQIDAKNQKRIKETQDAYNTQLANLRAYYSLRLAKGGSALPTVPYTTSAADGYSPDNLPAPVILAAQCAETTLTLVKLQDFIRAVQP